MWLLRLRSGRSPGVSKNFTSVIPFETSLFSPRVSLKGVLSRPRKQIDSSPKLVDARRPDGCAASGTLSSPHLLGASCHNMFVPFRATKTTLQPTLVAVRPFPAHVPYYHTC